MMLLLSAFILSKNSGSTMKIDSNLKAIAKDIKSGMSDSEVAEKWDYPSVELFRMEKNFLVVLGLLDASYLEEQDSGEHSR